MESKLAFVNIPTFYIESNDDNIMTKQLVQDVKGRVILSTIHGTKGLEFDNVFIIDVNSSVFPSTRCKEIEEERRLFYVGVTRSKNKLYICYDERQPSIFIKEIKDHILYKDIISFSGVTDDIIRTMPSYIENIEEYSIQNIISKLDYLDYDEYADNIFNYHGTDIDIFQLHDILPDIINNFCNGRNLIISNISTIFSDFLETYIIRTIQHIGNELIENLDYVMYALFDFKKSIDDIGLRKHDKTIEGKFGINFIDKSDMDIDNLITYFKAGIKINSYIDDKIISHFANSYRQYTSHKKSKDIIYDIFIISLIKSIIKGRNSILHLINFDKTNFILDKINKTDLTNYKIWLTDIEISYNNYFNVCHNIDASKTVIDSKTKVKCIMDVQYGDHIIRIKSSTSDKPKVETLIQALSCVSIARRNNIIINKCSIYNPITGIIYTWDLTDWVGENDTIYFLTEKFS